MAGKTTWNPAPWLSDQTWLLTDNSVVKTPPVEASGSGRRVRIQGHTESHPASQLQEVLRDAIRTVANKRGAEPWVQVGDSPDDNLSYHGNAAPNFASTPDFTQGSKFHLADAGDGRNGRHSDIAFEFVSEECPTITAIVWMSMHVDYSNDHILNSAITYRRMHPANPSLGVYDSWTGQDWWTPFGYYDNDPEVEAAREFLRGIKPIGDIVLPSRDYRKNSRAMVTEVIILARKLMDVETIQIPVWREARTPTLMTFRATGRTTLNQQLYQELLDHVQTSATIERIKQNVQQVVKDMRSLGIVDAKAYRTSAAQVQFMETVNRAFGEDLVCHMIPVTTTDDDEEAPEGHVHVEVVEDHSHTVSIDFKSGTLVVHCGADTQVLDAWNFERTKAELTGELDAFLGFARKQTQKRARGRVAKIVKERTPDEAELEIAQFRTVQSA